MASTTKRKKASSRKRSKPNTASARTAAVDTVEAAAVPVKEVAHRPQAEQFDEAGSPPVAGDVTEDLSEASTDGVSERAPKTKRTGSGASIVELSMRAPSFRRRVIRLLIEKMS